MPAPTVASAARAGIAAGERAARNRAWREHRPDQSARPSWRRCRARTGGSRRHRPRARRATLTKVQASSFCEVTIRPMPPETSQFRLPTCVVWAWTAGALKARALARAAAPSAVDLRWDMSTPNVFNRTTSTPTIRPSSISSRHGRAFRRPRQERRCPPGHAMFRAAFLDPLPARKRPFSAGSAQKRWMRRQASSSSAFEVA